MALFSLYLGMDFFYIIHDVMSHHWYVLKCLIDMNLNDCFPSPIPMDPSRKLSLEMDSPLLVASTITYYWMGLGKLLHATNIHLNIAYFISVMTKFTTVVHEVHFETMILIFYYLKGSLDFAIHYQQRGDILQIYFTNNDFLVIWISANLFLIICLT